jgi:hypothetical protein
MNQMRALFTFTALLGVSILGSVGCSGEEGGAAADDVGAPTPEEALPENIGQVTQAASVCPNGVQVRKEIRTLTSAEWGRFVNATKKLMSGTGPTVYDRLAKVHMDNERWTHNTAPFLAWHRAYLRDFERKLQAIDPSVTLPYWSSAVDSQAPEASIVFRSDWFGGNGASGSCVTNGAFGGWKPYFPAPHCLQRKFNLGSRISPFYSAEAVARVLQQSATYDALRRGLESPPHAAVHVGIGGDMATMLSMNDPIAWLADAYWDKKWADWQRMKPANMTSYGGVNFNGSAAKPIDALPGYQTTRVQDVLDTRSLCYVYAELPVP